MVKSAGLVLSLALKGPAPLASAPWHPAQFSMYSAWPLSASCANAPPIAAIRKAAAHSLTDIGLPIVLMSGRFRNKDLQLPADSLSVFDSNQESTVCYALNGFYEHEKAAKTRPRRIAVLGGDDSKSRIARSRTIFCASICRSHPISTAPNNHDLELKVLDGASPVVLPFPCRRTNAGAWINADLETGIDIQPTK